jgi:chemotaxis protein methyltransferase CheR
VSITPIEPVSISDGDIDRLSHLVRDASGLEFPDSRRPSLARAVQQTITLHGLDRADALHDFLLDPAHRLELEAFIASLTIGETHFFRNRPQLDALQQHILPAIIADHAVERRLRIWSAGCATGEEAYSLAMLIDTLLPRRDGWNILILATDINKQSLEKAQRGIYGSWSFRQVPPEIQSRYFVQNGRNFHLAPHIRDMVSFSYLNLVDDSYPSLLSNTQSMDLILCRNVLIYFREETINQVVSQLDDCLAPRGWLVPGHAESPMPTFRQHFAAREFPMAVCYQKRDPSDQQPGSTPLPGAGHPRRAEAARPVPSTAPASASVTPRDTRSVPPAPAAPPRARPAPPPKPDASPDRPDRAIAAWREGRVTEATGMLDRIAATDPTDPTAPYLTAKILASLVRLDEARTAVLRALDRDPLHARSHYLHGLILQEQGRQADALEALRRAVYLDPQLALGRFSLAVLFAATGQAQRAEKELDTLIGLLDDRDRDEQLDDSDGVTVGRLLELVAVHRDLIAAEGRRT